MKTTLRRNDLIYPELSYQIVGCAYEVFKTLGFGHAEKTYQKAFTVLFNERKIKYKETIICSRKIP